jgi:Fuc2NAc and GlcNAc transferase
VADAALSAAGFFLLGFVPGYVLQRMLIVLARRRGILAVPDHRSSHSVPTPTSGGVGFVVPVLMWTALAAWHGDPAALAIVAGGGLVAGVGLWDDVRPLPALPRLVTHALAIAFGLVVLWRTGPGPAGALGAVPAWLMAVGLFLALVWLLNLYNFMDGIDGLAAAQALVFGGGVLIVGDVPRSMAQALLLACGAVAAFFWYNRAPARIFMGDVGSGFLGFSLGIVAVALVFQWQMPPAVPLILLAPFIVDASCTLAVRALTGQRIASAHRSHAYQRMADRFGHGAVTWMLIGYGILWLIPLAALAAAWPNWSMVPVVASGIPVLALCMYYSAGLPERGR